MKLEEMCEGIPIEFLYYFKIVRNLSFQEEPNYNLLRDLFVKLYKAK